MAPLKAVKAAENAMDMLNTQIDAREKLLQNLMKSGALSMADKRKHKRILRFLENAKSGVIKENATDSGQIFARVKAYFDAEVAAMKEKTQMCQAKLDALFVFVDKAFAEGNEMLVLVTELTVNQESSAFIATFGCDLYQKHNEQLLLSERSDKLIAEIKDLKL